MRRKEREVTDLSEIIEIMKNCDAVTKIEKWYAASTA